MNQSRTQNVEKQMLPKTGLKFLMARKFDVPRSLQLYQSHETVRIREGVVKFDPLVDPLRKELETGKFTILVCLTDWICDRLAYITYFGCLFIAYSGQEWFQDCTVLCGQARALRDDSPDNTAGCGVSAGRCTGRL